jgi:hypothetical protein
MKPSSVPVSMAARCRMASSNFSFSIMIDQPQGRFIQGSQIMFLATQVFFSLFNFINLSFKLPGAMLRLLIGFFLFIYYLHTKVRSSAIRIPKQTKMTEFHNSSLVIRQSSFSWASSPRNQIPQVSPSKPMVTVSPSTMTGTLRVPLEYFNMVSRCLTSVTTLK